MNPVYFGMVDAVIGGGRLRADLTAPCAVFDVAGGFGEEVWVDALPDNLLALHLGGAAVHFVGNAQLRPAKSSSGSRLAVQPKGSETRYLAHGAVRFAHIYLPDALLQRGGDAMETDSLSNRLRDDLIFRDARELETAVCTYIRRILAADAPSLLEMEARALLIIDALARAHMAKHKPVRAGLAPWAERRCCEYIREHLAVDIALLDLAAIARLSPFHFARMFKLSTGLTPHAYQRRCRAEKAQQLLAASDLPVTQIALVVGYETPQAFARMFRAETGASPSEWRREVRA